MNPTGTDRYDLAWRRGELAPLIWLCLLAGAALIHAGRGRRVWFASGPPISPERISRAAEKIDPNTATVASLRRLSGIGRVKAEAIVSHRDQHGPVFREPDDLESVPGIGPETVRRTAPYLEVSQPRQ